MTYLARIGLALAVLWALPAHSQALGVSSGPATALDRLQVPQVLDLRYGDALFLQFSGEDLAAAARLETALESGLSAAHRAEAELLLGGLYLELGMHAEADRRLRRLLDSDVPAPVRNRAWFYLAQGWYLAGEPARAEDTVRRLAGLLPPELESQRVHLLANSLMRQGRFAEAADVLDGWQGSADWLAYARLNLGVALIRDNQVDVAAHYLTAAAKAGGASPELSALADLAGVTLASAYLQGGDAPLAGPALAGVRLDGPQASRALLLAGWAAEMSGDPAAAMTPWLELRGRDPSDPAVQEVLLAIPHAYVRLDAPAQAAAEYERALTVLAAQREALDAALVRARAGQVVDELLAATVADGGRGWGWENADLPPSGDLRLISGLLASNAFHERLRDQRDLAFLERRLAGRAADLDAFADLLEQRARASSAAVERAGALLASGRAESLNQRLAEVSRRVDAAAAATDPIAVAPAAVQQRWERVLRLEQSLEQAPSQAPGPAGDNPGAARERARLLRGALLWDALAQRPANLQQRELDVSRAGGLLLETQERIERIEAARAAYGGSGNGAARVGAARERLGVTSTRLRAAQGANREILTGMIVAELESRRRRVEAYEVQARFSLAALYDRASSAGPEAPRK